MNWKINKIGEPVLFEAGMPFMFFSIFESTVLENVEFTIGNLSDDMELMKSRAKYGDVKMKNNEENPWTWTKGIKTGLDADGNKIGPTFKGMPKLKIPGQ